MFKRPLCLLCLLFIIGILILEAFDFDNLQNPAQNPEILEYLESHPKVARIYGTVYRRALDGSSCYLKDAYLLAQPEPLPLENIKIYMDTPTAFPIGSQILMTGKLQPIPPAGNPGQFDSVLYYQTQHIYFRMVKASGTVRQAPSFPWLESLAKLREHMSLALNQAAGGYAPVYEAMLLGDKGQLEEETKDLYQMAGMMHMLAISGLHLSLLGWGLFHFLQKLGFSIAPAGIAATLILFSYGILTGEGVATMRALCMFSLSVVAKMTGRTYDLLSATALSAIFLLMDSPKYLFYSGFLLSFGCICSIGLVLPNLDTAFLPQKKHLLRPLLASLSIQLTTLPITLCFFYEFPTYGILLNLIAIPTLSVVLCCGFVTSLLGMLHISFASITILPGNLFLFLYDQMGTLAQRLPATTWITGKPQIWQVILYYAVFILFLRIIKSKKPREKPLRGLRAVLSLFVPAAAVVVLTLKAPAGCSITCLDVGQGDGIVLETPSGHHYLIDGGSSSQKEVGRYRILPYLKSQGIAVLDYVWVSHTDTDHISGIQEMLELQKEHRTSVSIKNLLLPKWNGSDDNYGKLKKAAKAANVAVHYMQQGDSLQDGTVSWQVLSPVSGGTEDVNESSQVLLFQYGSFQALFTGDIGEETEQSLIPLLPDIDFLKVAHHGSRYSTCEAFLKQTKPEIAVISSSAANTYGHPSPDTLARLKDSGCQYWCTKDAGAVMTRITDKRIQTSSYLPYSLGL